MSAKLLMVFVCAAVGMACGFAVNKSYKRNLAYLDGICGLIADLKRNVAYRRDPAAEVIIKQAPTSALFKKNIDEYLSYVGSKGGTITLSKGFLTEKIYDGVCGFFSSLGAADEAAQLRELEMYESMFSEYRKSASEKSEKYGAVAVKLGFLFGLCVGVLTL
ncbi:MAG: stage III sporulation protein AB [Roseburia sp.]|nr:stage III sporulation protein AB [Roseburia sp.]